MNKNNKKCCLILIALLFLPTIVYAETSFILRPQTGYGYIDSSGSKNGSIYHVGMRLLVSASETRRYGLEVSYFNIENGDDFTSLGIVLEKRLWNWFNMSIGTVGYFNYGAKSENPVGLMTNLGWEPGNYKTIKPFITYRNDIIFSDKIDMAYSLSVGVSLAF